MAHIRERGDSLSCVALKEKMLELQRLRSEGFVLLRCDKCHDIIYSEYGHDFVPCFCRKSFIDGGPQK